MSLRLSDLSAITSVVSADLAYTAQSPFGSGTSKKITWGNVSASFDTFNHTWTGTNTFQNTVTLDTRLILSGNQPFTAASGNAYLYHSNVSGFTFYGEGSTYDILAANKSGGTVFAVPTGTINVQFAGNITTSGSMTSIYSTVTTSGSTTLTDITRGLTIPGNLVTSAYVDGAYTALLIGASTTDNATKPKVGIFMKYTGVGTQLHFGTSQDYATGVTNSDFYIDHFGKVFLNACNTNTASLNMIAGTAPTSPVDGDMWYDGTNVKFRVGGTTKTFTLI